MSDISHKWVLGLGLAGLLVDLFVLHPMSNVENEYQHNATIPQHSVLVGFANERQWLLAHHQFRNQCVLEALAESRRSGENTEFTSVELNDGVSLADLRVPNND